MIHFSIVYGNILRLRSDKQKQILCKTKITYLGFFLRQSRLPSFLDRNVGSTLIGSTLSRINTAMSIANLFIVAAPSGAGKSSLISAVLQRAQEGHLLNAAQLSVSHTTRAAREGEIDGEHYHFIKQAQFEEMIAQDAFYEHAQVFENYYGTSKAAINDTLALGIDVFLDIDWQGARQIKEMNPNVVSIFILPPSKEELHMRLLSRGKDSKEVIQSRMQQAQQEMSHYLEFDYVIVNDNFTDALDHLITIVKSHSLRLQQQQARHRELIASLLV